MADDEEASLGLLVLLSSGGPLPSPGSDLLGPALIILGCLALSALFSGSEAGFLALPRLQVLELKEQGHPRAALLLRIINKPAEFVSSMMIANITVNLIMLVMWRTAFSPLLVSYWSALGSQYVEPAQFVIDVFIMTLALVVFAEVTPKAWAHNHPLQFCLTFSPLLPPVIAFVRPAVTVIRWISERLLRLFGIKVRKPDEVTEEELIHFIAAGTESGVIAEEGRDLIHSIFEFHDLDVAQVMVPRVDIIMVPQDATLREAMEQARDSGHSRLPVFHGDRDHVMGVILAKDMIRALVIEHAADRPIAELELIRQVPVVHETKPIAALFAEMKAEKIHVAIVLDEYGGTAGLVTIEDLIEELVGDIKDESDVEEPDFRFNAEGELIVDGHLALHELADLVAWEPPDNTVETIGGLIYQALGRVPTESEIVDLGGQTVQVLRVSDNRIREVALVDAPLTEAAQELRAIQRPKSANGQRTRHAKERA